MSRMLFASCLALLLASPLQAAVKAAPRSAKAPGPPAPVRAGHASGPLRPSLPPPPAPSDAQAVVLRTALGDIVLRLEDAAAPKTCANFRKLVGQGFYDGTCFHRVIAGFMIQGGDPNSRDANPANDGLGGPAYRVPAEIKLRHVRGAVATARAADGQNPTRASNGSQFFIEVAPSAELDRRGYTVFGTVIAGMDVVDRIAAFASDPSLPAANGGGRNPGPKAAIQQAQLVPLARYQKKASNRRGPRRTRARAGRPHPRGASGL